MRSSPAKKKTTSKFAILSTRSTLTSRESKSKNSDRLLPSVAKIPLLKHHSAKNHSYKDQNLQTGLLVKDSTSNKLAPLDICSDTARTRESHGVSSGSSQGADSHFDSPRESCASRHSVAHLRVDTKPAGFEKDLKHLRKMSFLLLNSDKSEEPLRLADLLRGDDPVRFLALFIIFEVCKNDRYEEFEALV